MKEAGYGAGYRYAHDDPGAVEEMECLPPVWRVVATSGTGRPMETTIRPETPEYGGIGLFGPIPHESRKGGGVRPVRDGTLLLVPDAAARLPRAAGISTRNTSPGPSRITLRASGPTPRLVLVEGAFESLAQAAQPARRSSRPRGGARRSLTRTTRRLARVTACEVALQRARTASGSDRRELAALAAVPVIAKARRRSASAPFIVGRRDRGTHRAGAVGGDGRDPAEVAVEDLALVVVAGLDDAVARTPTLLAKSTSAGCPRSAVMASRTASLRASRRVPCTSARGPGRPRTDVEVLKVRGMRWVTTSTRRFASASGPSSTGKK